MSCKTCKHSAYDHEYQKDSRSREQCRHKNEKNQRCNCREFKK